MSWWLRLEGPAPLWVTCQLFRPEPVAAPSKRLTAQLARTEEAAKRILTRSDPAARGGVAQRLLDLEREATALRAERAELQAQLEK